MTATTNTASKFDAMGKEELRAAMREAGLSYSKLNNDGMRAALVAHYAVEEVAEEVAAPVADEEEVVEPARPNVFAQMLGLAPTPLPASNGNGTRVVDGKKVDPNASKAKGESRARVEKNPAPAVPRVSRKGYSIQKEREERNGVKRPSEGTVCGNVWAEFDKNPEIKASDLADLADTNGWNRTNVSCEFYAWRKFMGIKGRSAK
jgi:hypothetical protein